MKIGAARAARVKTIALRAIPVAGWLYLLAGLIAALLRRAPRSRVLRVVWWADALLSTVGHAAQIPVALAADELASRSRFETAVMTQIFGLTWWKTRGQAPAGTPSAEPDAAGKPGLYAVDSDSDRVGSESTAAGSDGRAHSKPFAGKRYSSGDVAEPAIPISVRAALEVNGPDPEDGGR